MSIRIIADSCCEFPEELKKEVPCENVPLTLIVDEHEAVDDESFEQKGFLNLIANCKGVPRSACPSPERYMQSYDCKEDWVFVVTLSESLSGSYNAAVLAKELYEEEHRTEGAGSADGVDSANAGGAGAMSRLGAKRIG